MKADAEVGGPSSQGSTELWDTTFNRATNRYKRRDRTAPPTSAGRVSVFGTSMKFINYYHSDDAAKRERRRPANKDKVEVLELRKKVETLENQIVDSTAVAKLVDERLKSILPPGLVEGLAAWNAAGRQGPIYVSSDSGSNSIMNQNPSPDVTTPQPNATTPPTANAEPQPTPALLHDATARPENDRPAAGTGALVSTIAELDAITKVIS